MTEQNDRLLSGSEINKVLKNWSGYSRFYKLSEAQDAKTLRELAKLSEGKREAIMIETRQKAGIERKEVKLD